MNMKVWLDDMVMAKTKKAIPVLSFPSIQLLGTTVKELISSSEMQAKGMKAIADRVDSGASLSLMDLSLEAEAFGSDVIFSDNEVPTITGRIITSLEDAEALEVPKVGAGRTGIYVKAVEKATQLINDRPVFAGVIGPFSLAGRLMDVSEAMVNCYVEPDMVHKTLEKCTQFLISYIEEYKKRGANGVVMAEPLAGILSPDLIDEFSSKYVRQIVDAVQTDDFILIYHNCGNNVLVLIDSILSTGASAFHFGNAINMAQMLERVPANVITMGNIDPTGQFRNGTVESIRKATRELMEECCKHPNYVISSGCDIPPMSNWDNIDAFFETVKEFYKS